MDGKKKLNLTICYYFVHLCAFAPLREILKHMKKIVYINIFLIILISSCSDSKVFEEYHKFDNLSWNRFDNQKFDVPIEDTESEYDIFITFRHLPEIPYKEIKINLTIHLPDGEFRTADHIFELIDKEGNNLSECLGDFCDISFPVRKGFTFSEPGIVRFEIENKYTKVEMPGIVEVGLIVRKAN